MPKIISHDSSTACASDLGEAAEALRRGALVVFPTETVYGIAANAAEPSAIARLRAAKGRDERRPFTVHLGHRDEARKYLSNPSSLVRRLVRKAWPGPLTLICDEPDPQATGIAREFPAAQLGEIYHDRTVGLRCPDHRLAELLISSAGVPIVASSANRAGNPPPCELQEALDEVGSEVEFAIEGERTRLTRASTIARVQGDSFSIVREGALDERTLRRMARREVLFVCTGNSCRSPMAEHLFRHELARRLGMRIEDLPAAGYIIGSAGVGASTAAPASSGAIEELSRRGIDAAAHRARLLTIELVHSAERIFVMTPDHLASVQSLVPGAAAKVALLDPSNPLADPFGGTAEGYARCAEQIERAVAARVEEFIHEDRDW